MKATLKLGRNMRIIGSNEQGLETAFDAYASAGGDESAPSPMEILLQAMAACSFMDVVSILKKKRKQIDDLTISIDGHRTNEHPKVFDKVHLIYELISPDAKLNDLERSAELSQTKYCGASAMFQMSGCEVTYDCIVKPE